jgi:uncharacterized protein
MKIVIKAEPVETTAELNDSSTAKAIWNALPVTGQANLWGEEIYFRIPVHIEPEDGRELVEKGDLGFWPEGDAFCIFFGPTPMSKGDEIRPASAVNVFGRIKGYAALFKRVRSGTRIYIERSD